MAHRTLFLILLGLVAITLMGVPGVGETPRTIQEILYSVGAETNSSRIFADNIHLFDYESGPVPGLIEERSWTASGVIYADLSFESPMGGRVSATLVFPPGEGPFAGLIIQHGMPSDRTAEYELAATYARLGAVVVAIDAPFARHGRREQVPISLTERDRDEQIQLILDLRRVVDLLISRPGVDPSRIGYVGISYGAAMGGLLAGIEDRISAFALVVGDGGLVTHLLDPPPGMRSELAELSDADRRAWVDSMWPIEPIHYISHAPPSAILFQNGLHDPLVSAEASHRFHHAASEPKTIHWYPGGHALPFEHLLDQAIWLHTQIGIADIRDRPSANLLTMDAVEDVLIFHPEIRWLALVADRLILLWLALTLAGVIWLVWILKRDAVPLGSAIGWMMSGLVVGPLAAIGYSWARVTTHGFRTRTADVVSLTGPIIASLYLIVVAVRLRPDLFASRLAMLLLMILLPHGAHWLTARLRAHPCKIDTVVMTNVFLAAGFPLLALLIAQWIDVWFPMASWGLLSLPLWASLSFTGLFGVGIYVAAESLLIRAKSWVRAAISVSMLALGILLVLRML